MRLLLLLLLVIACAGSAAGHALQPVVLTMTEQAPHRFRIEARASGSALGEGAQLDWPAHCRVSGTLLDCAPTGLRGATLRTAQAREPEGGTESRELFVVVRFLDSTIESGVLRGAGDRLALAPLSTTEASPAGPARGILRRYAWLGMRHVVGGADHVLFVLALLFVVARARPLLFALTAFTLAHSLTLALATLGWVRPEPRWVEALIALSVLLLAREVLRPLSPQLEPPTWTSRHPMALCFTCGLLHGLGFAGALAEVGLPAGQSALALFAFNIGVELGQLGVVLGVLGVLGPLPWITRARLARPAAYVIGGLAAAWTIERIAALFAR